MRPNGPDGGAAFPSMEKFEEYSDKKEQYVTVYQQVGGMSLRDWFAGQWSIGASQYWANSTAEKLSAEAYAYADAMLKTREV